LSHRRRIDDPDLASDDSAISGPPTNTGHPLDQWCWLRDGDGCRVALQAMTWPRPRRAVGLRTGAGGSEVAAELGAEGPARAVSLEPSSLR
jgi:hypothetical protein